MLLAALLPTSPATSCQAPVLVSLGESALLQAYRTDWSCCRLTTATQETLLGQYAYIVLTGVFTSANEPEAALLHALGATLNYLLLLQV